MYKNINDYEQLYLISENDDYAKELIFEKYKPIIVSIAKKYYSYISSKSEIEDFIQEGYIGLSRAIDSFNERENVLFYTFSLICIERQIRSYYRKLTTMKNNAINTAYSLDMEIDDFVLGDFITDPFSMNNPNIYVDSDFYNNELIHFKNTLEFKHSVVFELRYNGFKYREISNLLDIPISVVDNYIHLCKEKLKNYFTLEI